MAEHRHRREPNARRRPRATLVAAPVGVLATAGVVSLGVLTSEPAVPDQLVARDTATDVAAPADDASSSSSSGSSDVTERPARLSRDAARDVQIVDGVDLSEAATRQAVKAADLQRWSTTALNLWELPGEDADQDGELEAGKKVLATGRSALGRVEIVVDGQSRWVTEGYLADEKPLGAGAGLSMEPCPDGSVENGLTEGAVYVYRSVCNAFPEITSYGGWDDHGEHVTGKALDIMTSDTTLGTAIAEFLQEHASELNLYDIIWQQHIWTPVRASEGWRPMEDRGSPTANHYDHVHVSVN